MRILYTIHGAARPRAPACAFLFRRANSHNSAPRSSSQVARKRSTLCTDTRRSQQRVQSAAARLAANTIANTGTPFFLRTPTLLRQHPYLFATQHFYVYESSTSGSNINSSSSKRSQPRSKRNALNPCQSCRSSSQISSIR